MLTVSSALAIFLVSVLPVVAGDLTGQVSITKRLTKKTVAPTVYSLRGTAPPPAHAETDAINEFDRTIVILEGGKTAAPAPETAVIEQRDSRFEPDLVVIPVGSTVQFPNSDPIFHNVFSLSGAQPFDLGFYSKSQSRSVKFTHAGIVQVYCHIHSNMYAGIVVTASPWYGKPAADGSFTWKDIPAGHYRVVAWHKIAGLHQVQVDVPETGTVNVTVRVPIDVEQHP
jgi:plastocyanin